MLIVKLLQTKRDMRGIQEDKKVTNLRSKYFRNVNDVDNGKFEHKRQKVFKSMYKIKKMAESGVNWGSQI